MSIETRSPSASLPLPIAFSGDWYAALPIITEWKFGRASKNICLRSIVASLMSRTNLTPVIEPIHKTGGLV